MKIHLQVFLLILLIPSFSFGQTWLPLGSGVNQDISALGVYNNNLYAQGYFDTAGGMPANYIAKWNGVAWSTLGIGLYSSGFQYQYGQVCGLINYNGNLIVGGWFDSAGGIHASNIAKWNGSSWDYLGHGANYIVKAFTIYNGNLIAAGNFSTAGGEKVDYIAEWNGSSWDSLSSGMDGDVGAVIVYKGKLIAGGGFTKAGRQTANGIAEWNGSSWDSIGSISINGHVNALDTLNGYLYAGGQFDSVGGIRANNIAEWNGTTWDSLRSGVTLEWNAGVYTLTNYNGNLIVGGQFDNAGGIHANNIATWNGSAWSTLCSGMNNGIGALIVFNSNLYAAGYFDTAGGMPANYIAKWNDTAQCTITGIPQLSNAQDIKIYPNPNNGTFTISLHDINEPTQVEVYNMLGEKVLTEILCPTQDDNTMGLTGQPNGFYLYRITTQNGGILGEGKLIIQR